MKRVTEFFVNIARRIARSLNRIVCGCPVLKKFFLPPPQGYVSVKELEAGGGVSKKIIFPETRIRYDAANCLYGIKPPDFGVRERAVSPACVWSFKSGIVFSDYGYILCRENGQVRLVRELSVPLFDREFEEHFFHEKYKWRYFNKITGIDGSVAVINSSCASHNYFHWLIEALPRLYLVKASGIEPDYYYISNDLPFHRSTIKALNIPEEKIISPVTNTCIEAAELVVPALSIQAKPEKPFNFNHAEVLPAWVHTALNSLLKVGPQEKYNRKIYISRSDTNKRKMLNEEELVSRLESKGFKRVNLEGLGVKEQAEIFASASVVVAPHGAGLANLIFCRSGTKLVEILSDGYSSNYCKTVANISDMEYYCLFFHSQNAKFDFYVDIDVIANEIAKLIG